MLGIDANDDVRLNKSEFAKAMQKVGLREVITDQHGTAGPSTYNRGSITIDGLFCTSTLTNLQCGYLPFQDDWDHRPLWIDIPTTIALGHDLQDIVRAPARRLKCNDPRIVTKFQTEYWQFLLDYKLAALAETLFHEIGEGTEGDALTTEQAKRYEYIKTKGMEGLFMADKNCRKVFMGGVQWSPTYQAAVDCTLYWNLLVKQISGKQVATKLLLRKAKLAGIIYENTWTLEEAREMLTAAYGEKKKASKNDRQLRHTYLDALAAAKAQGGTRSAEQEKEDMIRREDQRKNARMIRSVNQKMRGGAIRAVLAPHPLTGVETEMSTKEDIERACLAENERQFRQASDTPFMQPPLLGLVGPLGMGPAADSILRGDFDAPPGIDPYALKLIQHLKRPDNVTKASTQVDISLLITNHINGWKRAKERTSSGRSGVHFGHFMAGAKHTGIVTFDATMAQIPYQTGYSPKIWQHGVNVMLVKKKGDYRVSKLRAILLYEADFNQNNKRLGREMMYYAEDLKNIAPEQYGSRKNHTAIDHGLNKQLTFDLMRIKKKPGAVGSTDALSCYNRVVHSVASLSMRRQGIPPAPIICMFTTIQKLKHYIRTIFGDSELSFGGDLWAVKVSDGPIQGLGQGNGAAPQMWAVVSTPVLEMLRSEGHCCFFKAAISGDEVSFVGYAFVDDTDQIVTSPEDDASFQEIAHRMQASVTAWQGGIRATGGAIVPEKSHWYLIDFVWMHGHWHYVTEAETPAQISVQDSTGTEKMLERLAPDKARRTLGVRLAPDGNCDDQFKFMVNVATEWGEHIRTGHLPRHLVWESMHTTILRTLLYPLPATTLSQKQCHQIMAPILKYGLPCAGIV